MSIARDLARLRTPIQTQYGGTPSSLIDGLIPSYINGTSISFSPGVAYIPGLGRPLVVSAPIILSGLTPTANSWHYFYLYENNGIPSIEMTVGAPNAPDAPYMGTARTKPGDTTRRFIFAMRSAVGSATFYNFVYQPNNVFRYLQSINAAPFRVSQGGAPTTPTAISVGSVVPTCSSVALVSFTLTQGSAIYDMYISHTNFPAAIISYVRGSTSGSVTSELLFPITSNSQINVWLSSASGTILLDVAGYMNDR